MINRILIRIKVLQIVFAFYQNGSNDLKVAENELHLSLRRSYDLYYYFLLLIVEVTRLYERKIEMRRNKFLATDKDKNPDLKLLNNRLAKQILENESLNKYIKEHGISWVDDAGFVNKILDKIENSDFYAEYQKNDVDTYDTDKEFWRLVFKRLIMNNEDIETYLEEKCIYWNEDIDIIESFVIKTIKRFEEQNGANQELLPMFNNQDDYEYVMKLFRESIIHGDEYRGRIGRHSKNWESERVANMDLVIMQVAIAEIMSFPTIPISVTLNEYIDAAKYYSTPKSGIFINGVLNSIVEELKEEKLLLKN